MTPISTGAYRYPLDEAAPIALRTVSEELRQPGIELARFVLFDPDTYAAYQRVLGELAGS